MSGMRSHLIVNDCKHDEGYAGVENFDTVESRPCPAHGHQSPAEDERVLKCDTLGREGPVSFVEFVFLWTESLVRHVELQEVQPNPENNMGKTRDLGEWASCDSEEGLSRTTFQCIVRHSG